MRLLISILFIASSLSTVAQSSSFKGQVKHCKTDASIPKAIVNMLMDDNSILAELTDEEGNFDFENIAPGRYTVIVSKSGFDVEIIRGIEIRKNKIHFQNVDLSAKSTKKVSRKNKNAGNCNTP